MCYEEKARLGRDKLPSFCRTGEEIEVQQAYNEDFIISYVPVKCLTFPSLVGLRPNNHSTRREKHYDRSYRPCPFSS